MGQKTLSYYAIENENALIGPFFEQTAAESWAERHLDGEWQVHQLEHPSEKVEAWWYCPDHPKAGFQSLDPTGGDPELGGPVIITVCEACGQQIVKQTKAPPGGKR